MIIMDSVLTVSGLNSYLSFKLKSDSKLKGIMIEGEISNFVRHYKSLHLYFTLKDAKSSVKCVMFASNAARLKFIPSNGMRVVIYGNVEVYECDGVYQVYAFDMNKSGVGELYFAFEKLKEKLLNEGVFDETFKKQLPLYPQRIGIVTSKDGAGLRDIINIISNRYPLCEVTLYPALVQGVMSADSLVKSMVKADKDNNDVIIIGRGGGSFEDLLSFNDETLARLIFKCKTPVVSAVGHETDFTICDFVADKRAETPSAAAVLVTPDINELKSKLDSYQSMLVKTIINIINEKSKSLDKKTLDLKKIAPGERIISQEKNLAELKTRLKGVYNNILSRLDNNFKNRVQVLESLSPLTILNRGYSLCYKEDKLIMHVNELNKGDIINLRLSDGNINAFVK